LSVKNTGHREGVEVVQLYLRDGVASVSRPIKELKGFKRITLMPGEKKNIDFAVAMEHLSFVGPDMKRTVEPGTFVVMIGKSSEDIRLTGSFELNTATQHSQKRKRKA
jgi:beta-glucosidase